MQYKQIVNYETLDGDLVETQAVTGTQKKLLA